MPEITRPVTSMPRFCEKSIRAPHVHFEERTYHRGALQDATQHPNPARQNHDLLPPDLIGQATDDESTDEGACRHGGHDGALGVGAWVAERVLVSIILEMARSSCVSPTNRSRCRERDLR